MRFTFVDESMMGHCEMASAPDGEWVRHADYLTLQAEYERLREVNAIAEATAYSQEQRAERNLAGLRAAESQLTAFQDAVKEWLARSDFDSAVKAADKLRALVDPSPQEKT